jgi:hypothetical protein
MFIYNAGDCDIIPIPSNNLKNIEIDGLQLHSIEQGKAEEEEIGCMHGGSTLEEAVAELASPHELI